MQSQKGVSLAEMLVAVMLVALLATFGLPALQRWQLNARINQQSHALTGLVQQARSGALESGRHWTLCGSGDGQRCGKNRDADWRYALLLNASGNIVQRLRVDNRLAVYWHGFRNRLHFSPRLASAMLNGSFYVCADRADRAKRIVINRLGRIRHESVAAGVYCGT
ncbi:GspH/FimT family pseudopilin [Kushneria aurantia]|uniref:Type II secretion system protein H n=1 Tax=Kushneria aurantia TaxID=504092 RepID=A0ABV6FYQ5_9GAMM|nr:GspH/FimT family pseudopilin [Kushneria aurantia]